MARMDADGYYTIAGRYKDMIISGGENVYSSEVENVLRLHPMVAEAAVIGLPDVTWGERVTAVVVARGDDVDEPSLIDHCRARLAAFKCPKQVLFTPSLPYTGAGKVDKAALRARLVLPTTAD